MRHSCKTTKRQWTILKMLAQECGWSVCPHHWSDCEEYFIIDIECFGGNWGYKPSERGDVELSFKEMVSYIMRTI